MKANKTLSIGNSFSFLEDEKNSKSAGLSKAYVNMHEKDLLNVAGSIVNIGTNACGSPTVGFCGSSKFK